VSFESCDCDAGTGQKTSFGLNTKSLTFEETVVANESKVELQKSAISETHREQSDIVEITENENEFRGVSINSDSAVVCFSAP